MQRATRAIICLAALPLGGAVRAKMGAEANPVRKVVTMLQGMQKKVTEEGEKEKELFEKFDCFCKNGDEKLQAAISGAETKVPQLISDLEESRGKVDQTKEELKQAKSDKAMAKEALDEATAIREKEAASFADEKADFDTNIAAMAKAIAALEKGVAGSFLQSGDAQLVKDLAGKAMGLMEQDRAEVIAFLSGTLDYEPQSGAIIGILKQMLETMQKSLSDATATEKAAIASYEDLVSAKTKEMEALTDNIETKTAQIGDLKVAIVSMEEDLEDTKATMSEDKKYLVNLAETCAAKKREWQERSKTRADELVALADTIKILNDDDALELFKKTLPSPETSFMQLTTTMGSLQGEALSALKAVRRARHAGKDRVGLDRLVLALTSSKGKTKGGFDKVVGMIDDMVGVLKEEQLADDKKKEYCEKEFDESDDKKKALERSISDEENSIQTVKDTIETLTKEIEALETGIKELDQSVAEATEQRKKENAEYKELMASDTAAKELLNVAKNRLNKFYNPKLYKAPAKKEQSEEDRIAENMGSEEAPEFVQLSSTEQGKEPPAPPPATWDAYSKKSQESTGVIAMVDLLIKDLDKEMTEAQGEEKNAQAEYEKLMEDSAEKRTVDSKALAEKDAGKADMEDSLETHRQKKKDFGAELTATKKYIMSLHAECDWLLQYFDTRKEARAGEVDAMKKAKDVLRGADYS